MEQGYIVRLVADRGFGFIKALQPDDEGVYQEWFFHRSACDALSPFERLRVKDVVTFEEEAHEKGMRAVDVRRV